MTQTGKFSSKFHSICFKKRGKIDIFIEYIYNTVLIRAIKYEVFPRGEKDAGKFQPYTFSNSKAGYDSRTQTSHNNFAAFHF